MKKILLASLVAFFSCGFCIAAETPAQTSASATSYSSNVNFPTGVYFNDNKDFVKVEKTWVRISIQSESDIYDIQHTEKDPWGNYVLVLSNRETITIDSNGRSLYYGGSKYSKYSMY